MVITALQKEWIICLIATLLINYFAWKILSQSRVPRCMCMFLIYFCSIFPPLPEAQWKQTAVTHSWLLPSEKQWLFQHQRKGGFQFASLSSNSQGLEMLITIEKQMRITALTKLCLAQALGSDS